MNKQRILITGHCGLIGKALWKELEDEYELFGLDLVGVHGFKGDFTKAEDLSPLLNKVDGVIHLAAVSRVVTAENDKEVCWNVNALGTENLFKQLVKTNSKAWLILASSREVYGNPQSLPVQENAPVRPINIYGKSKVYAEEALREHANKGLRSVILRFSNVYGSPDDHSDRVLPAFAKAALLKHKLRVEGESHTFDFTHLKDTVRGISICVQKLCTCEIDFEVLHLVTGVPTTLAEAARIALEYTHSNMNFELATERDYGVANFYGDPYKAQKILGWQALLLPSVGIPQLIDSFKEKIFR